MKNLVIVESPTKAKTIGKFLGKDYIIKFSMGHVMDLPKSKMAIDMEHDFKPEYEVVPDKKPLIAELTKLAKDANSILLATDPDREGEAISDHIQELLTKAKITKDKFKRIVFHEITEGAIKEAVASPRKVDQHLVDAQTARRVLDRLVGYKLSPLLWKKVRRGLSAGRVQSVALRLIVEREREIEKFGKEIYFTIAGVFKQMGESKGHGVEFELVEINGAKIEVSKKLNLYDGDFTFSKTIIDKKEKADDILLEAKKYNYVVSDVATRQAKRSPNPPFTTSTLQQAAANRLGLPGKRTMSLAQKLYEEGFITYHRTDSTTLAPVAIKQMREYIQKEYGDKYVPGEARIYTTKQKNAQEAHEGIRPTQMNRLVSEVKSELGEAYGKLYDLIWKRALASQMTDALIESTTVFADAENKKYRFKTTGSVLLFDGFLKLTPQALEDKSLPKFVSNEKITLQNIRADEHETTPPPRYNDASLIKTLEEKSIGRPSTYASIIGTITDRGYIERVERKFIPTSVGMAVNDFLVKNFSTIDDIPFTAGMEDDLDAVASGEKDWHKMMKEFYDPFAKKLTEVEGAARVAIPFETTNEICPLCHKGKLVIRTGRFGKFFSCDQFPACRFTRQFVEETNVLCPKDGGKVIVKKTQKGRKFYGCSNYPKCDFAAWKLEDIKKKA
ncbi:MAG TPA: type I DNA topoisomerase [Patescibacteria group bacterium]